MKCWKSIAVLAMLLLLTACSNTAAIRDASGLKLTLNAKENQGYVVLKVINLRPISLLNPHWKSIKIASKSEHTEIANITPQYNMLMGKHIPTESLYFAKLDAGEYRITGMGSVGAEALGLLVAILTSDNAKTKQDLKFSVKAGQLANLGTLVFVPEIENESPEQLFTLTGPSGKKAAYDTLLAESSNSALTLTEGGGWEQATTAEAEAGFLSEARGYTSMLTLHHQATGLEMSSHLGQIYKRTGIQSWQAEAVNTLDRIYAIAHTTQGKKLVGSDYGHYFLQQEDSSWSARRLPDEKGRIVHIAPRPDGSAIFISGDLLKTRVWLVKSLDSASEPAAMIAQLDGPPDNLLVADDELIVAHNIPGLLRESIINRINIASLQVTSSTESFWLVDWTFMPDDTVWVSRMNGLSLYQSTWEKRRTLWKHSDKPGYMAYWQDLQHGVAIKGSPGFSMVSNQLILTANGGQSWTPLGKPMDTRDFAGRVVYADNEEILLQGSNMLFSTKDRGQSWQRLFPPSR